MTTNLGEHGILLIVGSRGVTPPLGWPGSAAARLATAGFTPTPSVIRPHPCHPRRNFLAGSSPIPAGLRSRFASRRIRSARAACGRAESLEPGWRAIAGPGSWAGSQDVHRPSEAGPCQSNGASGVEAGDCRFRPRDEGGAASRPEGWQPSHRGARPGDDRQADRCRGRTAEVLPTRASKFMKFSRKGSVERGLGCNSRRPPRPG